LLVCRRELGSMCGGPLAWALTAVFLLLTGYFFYSDLALFVLVGGANQTRGLWRFVFLDFRLVALLVVPLLTMRLFAEERKQGTLELLWTFPVRDGEVLAGKVLAALALYLGMLAATAIGPALLYALHPFAVAPGPSPGRAGRGRDGEPGLPRGDRGAPSAPARSDAGAPLHALAVHARGARPAHRRGAHHALLLEPGGRTAARDERPARALPGSPGARHGARLRPRPEPRDGEAARRRLLQHGGGRGGRAQPGGRGGGRGGGDRGAPRRGGHPARR